MKKRTRIWPMLISMAIMGLLILDTDTAVQGAGDGVDLCINVIIPSLFPFFIITTYLNGSLMGQNIFGLRPLASRLNIPIGGDSLLLLGLIGGYPVGAQLVAQAQSNHQISSRTGRILLGYCSNAGPAFIFGVAGMLFPSKTASFILWGIHIAAALITGYLLPRPETETISWNVKTDVSIVNALSRSIRICATTCGWIIVFKVLLAYLDAWVPCAPGNIPMILLSGFLELSNGCLKLAELASESVRFVLCSVFLSFGGFCVMLQTASVAEEAGLGLYIPGKILQTSISAAISCLLSGLLFPNDRISAFTTGILCLQCVLIILAARINSKKV